MKTIIFDLGGVIINIDSKKFFDYIKSNFSRINLNDKITELIFNFELGCINENTFFNELQSILNFNEKNKLKNMWNSMLLDIPYDRIKVLNKVKKKYDLILFSNTNIIHYKEINKYLFNKYNIRSFKYFFSKIYLSYECGLRKPDINFYKLIMKENNLMAEEIIYIDDTKENIDAAMKCGWQCYLHKQNSDIDYVVKL